MKVRFFAWRKPDANLYPMNPYRLRRVLFVLSLAMAPLLLPGRSLDLRTITIGFYSEELTVAYPLELRRSPRIGRVEEVALVHFYQQLRTMQYQPLLESLEHYRRRYRLNDWLFYRLLRRTVSGILHGQPGLQQELTAWFLLTEAGYDTRLTFFKNRVYLYVYSPEEIFEVPMIRDKGRVFVNLTNIRQSEAAPEALYLLSYRPGAGGKPFSFYLPQLPQLRTRPTYRTLTFFYGEKQYHLQFEIDKTVIDLMKDYPYIAESQYMEVPLSGVVANSLLPQLRNLLRDKSPKKSLELLVALTRSSFEYRDDKAYFGRSKPMIADEVFHYPYSDCEDRSALFFRLVRELLDLPMLILAFPDHLTIAVAAPGMEGAAVRHAGLSYYICDPTGPVNSYELGKWPAGYENASYKVIGAYR